MTLTLLRKARTNPAMQERQLLKSLDEQVDNTETTVDDDDFEDDRGDDIAQCTTSDSDREVPFHKNEKKKTTKSEILSSESLEASLIELQHELLERQSQCSALREMLASVSGSVQEQQEQIQNQTTEIKSLKRRLRKAVTECKEWKEKYEALFMSLKNQSTVSSSSNAVDPLLGTLPEPTSKDSHFFQSQDDCSKENELSHNTDSEEHSEENYESEDLDYVHRPRRNRLRFADKAETSIIRSENNTEDDFGFSNDDGLGSPRKTRSIKSKIRRSVRLGVFMKKTTACTTETKKTGTTTKSEDNASICSKESDDCYIKEESSTTFPTSARTKIGKKKSSIRSMVSEESEHNGASDEAEKRRIRIQRQARKEAQKAAFDVQQLEC